MTKAQLIRTLEPFDDSIDIIVLDERNYKYEPRVFYYMDNNCNGQIILVTSFEPLGKATELKVRG